MQIGQTRPGRIGDAPHAAVQSPTCADPAATLQQALREHTVVVFSKLICPSCCKAKEVRLPACPGMRCFVRGAAQALACLELSPAACPPPPPPPQNRFSPNI